MADEACGDDLRLLPRSATNTYFPQTVTVISLTKADDRVRQAIAEHKTTIDGIRALPNFLDVLRAIPQTKEAFKDFSDDEIKQRAGQRNRLKSSSPNINPRIAEFDLLAKRSALHRERYRGLLPLRRDFAARRPWASGALGLHFSRTWSRCINCAK